MQEVEEYRITIVSQNGTVVINGLKIRNKDAVELLNKLGAEEAEALIDSLLATIAKVAEGVTTAQAIMKEFREQMDRRTREEFESFRKELSENVTEIARTVLEEFRGSSQEVSKIIEKNSREIEELIERKIGKKLQEVIEKISVKEKEMELRERTPLKGLDFEIAVFEECKRMLDGTEEVVDFVGNKQGALKKKTGDIVIRHSPQKGGIKPTTVVECKDKDLSGTSAREVLAEIDVALANREADACLYLIKAEEQMPPCFRPIKIGTNFVIASCDIDLGLLVRIAKLVSSLECRIEAMDAGIDVDSAMKELRNITALLNEFSEIRRLSQLASQHSLTVSEKAGTLRTKIENSVNRTIKSLEKKL